ncbi:MAG: TSUP family transporter, partial [Pseudomonadota bacterium]
AANSPTRHCRSSRGSAAVLLLGVAIAGLGAAKDLSSVRWGELVPALAGRAVGSVLASLALGWIIGGGAIPIAIACSTLFAVALSIGGLRVAVTTPALLAAGGLSGFMAAFTSIGAPPMGLLYQREAGPEVRATLNLFFLIGMAFSLAALLPHGLLRLEDLFFAIALLPAIGLGYLAGRVLARSIGRRSLRPAILTLATVAAILILLRAAFA